MKDDVSKYLIISLIANTFLSFLKIIVGLFSGFKSLVADGIHSFSDLITDVISMIGAFLSKKPADKGHPRGHGKIEYITSLIISVSIIILGITILKNSFSKENTIPNIYICIIIFITIIVKYIVSHTLIKKGEEINSTLLIASAKESFADVYSSVLVLFITAISQFHDKFKLLKYSDMVGSILISVMILTTGIRLLFQSVSLLIGESEKSKDIILKAKTIIKDREIKLKIKECIMHKYGSYYEVILSILVDGDITVRDAHKLMDSIEKDLINSDLKIKYVVIHIEPID